MDISASQYNSASESGWTHYLDESSLSGNFFQKSGGLVDYGGKGARMQEEEEEEEEEDLSMVSDASSGPPHYRDNYDDEYLCENWYPCLSATSQYPKESKKKVVKENGRSQEPSYLDDTASSPVFSCSKKKDSFSGNGAVDNALDFSHGFSATRIRGKPKFQKHFGFFNRSITGNQASEGTGGFNGERRKLINK
ncbi:hypothetical protein L6164_024570 [Bauhinia variegata]|uniref:Uncharacterized protein n=1 Tax=Bauhinia variegata TaxID=167791 RepID=A0ACB9LXM4_BAUVA|nr:hypothetical protein L6164_024570 [Bauhinia variegata]